MTRKLAMANLVSIVGHGAFGIYTYSSSYEILPLIPHTSQIECKPPDTVPTVKPSLYRAKCKNKYT